MKNLFVLFVILTASFSYGQKLKFKINGQKDTTIFLVKYHGKQLYYADTAEIKGGVVEFNGAIQKPGIMAVLLPQQKYFEFIYNNEEIDIETTAPEYVYSMNVKKSEENKVFVDYMKFLDAKRKEANQRTDERGKLKVDEPRYKELTREIDAISAEVKKYQQELITANPGKLVSKVVKMGMEIEIPEAPKGADGKPLDSLFAYHYYRDHYFDNIDLKDDRLVNTPVFHNKLETYFGKTMMIQHYDTIIKYAFEFCDKLDPKSKIFEYTVTWITSTFEKSNVMGMDKVFFKMAQRYYCSKNAEGKSPAFWMPEDKLATLTDKVNDMKYTIIGDKLPNLILRDTTDVKWVDYYSLKSEYTILYFWDPECGHCKKITPKMQELYSKKLKARNVEVYAVGKAIGEDFEKWKKYIRDNNLTFINAAVTDPLYKAALTNANEFVPKYTTLESLNYQTTFDLQSYPRIFVVDKNKKLIAKQLSVSQLEDMLDNLQNQKDAPKLFPPDPEEDENMQH